MSDLPTWPTGEPVSAVLADFEAYRNYLRARASEAGVVEGSQTRNALIDAVVRFNDLEDGFRRSWRLRPRGSDHLPGNGQHRAAS